MNAKEFKEEKAKRTMKPPIFLTHEEVLALWDLEGHYYCGDGLENGRIIGRLILEAQARQEGQLYD